VEAVVAAIHLVRLEVVALAVVAKVLVAIPRQEQQELQTQVAEAVVLVGLIQVTPTQLEAKLVDLE
jgi:hypothetical protein